MLLNLDYRNEKTKDVISFLNLPAIDFYSGKLTFSDPTYAMTIKSLLVVALNHVERSIKGMFNCDLFLRGVSNENKSLNKMFPVGCYVACSEDIGKTLCKLRNMNAHARSSDEDLEFFDKKEIFKKIYNLRRINTTIKTVLPNNVLTMGGYITLIMLFLRKESIEKLARQSKVFGLISSGSTMYVSADSFIQNISHVNLELPIRKEIGNDICSAVFGEYLNKVKTDANGIMTIIFGSNKNPVFRANLRINSITNEIKVYSGSLTKVYYSEDYKLHIEAVDQFIKLANMLPPLVIVDLLFKLKINVFDKETYDYIAGNMEKLYSKLNKPKFYIDKNVDILLLPHTNADYRITSSLLSEGLSDFFLRFEEEVCRDKNFSDAEYSKLLDSLTSVGFSNSLTENIIVLRNFCMHGYVFSEYQIRNNIEYQYSLDFVTETLREMLLELKEKNQILFKNAQENIIEHIVTRLMRAKYKNINEYSLDVFNGRVKFDPNVQEVKNKTLFIQSSFFKADDMNKMFVAYKPEPIVEEYHVEGEEEVYYLWADSQKDQNLFQPYLKSRGHEYVIDKRVDNGVLTKFYLRIER